MIRHPVILQVLPALTIGGAEQGSLDIAQALAQAGARALVAGDTGPLLPRLRYMGGIFEPLPLPKSFSPVAFHRKVLALRALVRREGVDLIHARSRYPALIASIVCRKEKIPLVTTWHGVHEAHSWLKRRYNRALLKGERVIAVSRHIGQCLEQDYAVSQDRIDVIPRGADPERFDPARVSGMRVQALAERWNFPEGSKILLVPGRLTVWKGQHVILAALQQLMMQESGPVLAVFVGPETQKDYARKLGRMVQSLGLGEHVRFVGECEDMPAAYRLADIVLIPSLKPEPFGRVAVEAQMMERPVIGSALGGMMETIFRDEGLCDESLPCEGNRLVEQGGDDAAKAASWAASILDMLRCDDALLARNSQKARAHMLACYTTAWMQAATLGVYDRILSGRLPGITLQKNFLSSAMTSCPQDFPGKFPLQPA